MPILASIDLLDPRMQPGVRRYQRRAAEIGQPIAILETSRQLSTHMAYYARGRAPVDLVRAYFQRCGLWAITDAEAATTSTQTLYGKHLLNLAVDVAPLSPAGNAWWAAPLEVWERMWQIAEAECGLDACAGGKWEAWQRDGRPWDLPHHEFKYEVLEAA